MLCFLGNPILRAPCALADRSRTLGRMVSELKLNYYLKQLLGPCLKAACGVKSVPITFTYADKPSDCNFADGRRGAFGSWRLEIDGTINNLLKAASIVRAHAIKTGNMSSVRLVRLLKDAETPEQISSAISAFRKWTAEAQDL